MQRTSSNQLSIQEIPVQSSSTSKRLNGKQQPNTFSTVNQKKGKAKQPPQESFTVSNTTSGTGTFEMGKYKTKLCRHWKTGYCLFGPNCVFAHGVDDLCEPNLLVQQMSNLVLVPVNMPGYSTTYPMYSNEAGGIASSNGPNPNAMPSMIPMTMPMLPMHPGLGADSLTSMNGAPLMPMMNNLSFYHHDIPQRNETSKAPSANSSASSCASCHETFSSSQPRVLLPCMHEFHSLCAQNSEKSLLEQGCPSCNTSHKIQEQPTGDTAE